MRIPLGDRLEAALFVIITLLVAKYIVKNVGQGAYAHYADDF